MKRKARISRLIKPFAAFCLAGILFVLSCNLLVILSTHGDIHTLEQAPDLSADCILVLGCGVRGDGTPSQMLKDRLDAAIAAYRLGFADRLLMSGDHGQDHYDEVNAMKTYAMEAGIPSERIFMDHAGFSTYESMTRAREIFQCETIIVVTQRYHLYRALYNARAMGMDAQGILPVDRHFVKQPIFDAREALARVKDVLYCMAKPDTAYGGDVIPIMSSSGDITNDR